MTRFELFRGADVLASEPFRPVDQRKEIPSR